MVSLLIFLCSPLNRHPLIVRYDSNGEQGSAKCALQKALAEKSEDVVRSTCAKEKEETQEGKESFSRCTKTGQRSVKTNRPLPD